MNARDRFVTALAETVSTAYYTEGEAYLRQEQIKSIAEEQQVSDAEMRASLDLLDDQGLLLRRHHGRAYSDGIGLMLRYEEADRRLFWTRNKLRREILRLAAILN